MDDMKRAQELFDHLAGKTVESMTVWADANQRWLRELVQLGSGAARESAKLYADLQRNTIEAVREAQATVLRWPEVWKDVPSDPAGWWQRAVAEGTQGAQQTFRLVEGNAQAFTRTAERLQSTAEQAGKGIQEAFTEAVSKTKDLYSRN